MRALLAERAFPVGNLRFVASARSAGSTLPWDGGEIVVEDIETMDWSGVDLALVSAGKTASLLATAARIGALVADHPRDVVEAVTDFGHHYGMAFQVVDDLLDVVATDEQLGKPAGNDLVEGTYTLPVIRALAGPAGDDLRSLLGGPIDSTDRDRARELVRADGAISSTRETAVGYLADAQASIAGLPANPAVDAMLTTCDLLVERLDRTT